MVKEGPSTAGGKAASSRNSIKHGLSTLTTLSQALHPRATSRPNWRLVSPRSVATSPRCAQASRAQSRRTTSPARTCRISPTTSSNADGEVALALLPKTPDGVLVLIGCFAPRACGARRGWVSTIICAHLRKISVNLRLIRRVRRRCRTSLRPLPKMITGGDPMQYDIRRHTEVK